MNVEKEAFEQGYAEGERIGKQMGEKMVETVVKRYEHSICGTRRIPQRARSKPWKRRRFVWRSKSREKSCRES